VTRITRSALRRDVLGRAVIEAAKDSMVRYGYYEHRRVLREAGVLVNADSVPWDIVLLCVTQDLKVKPVKVNAEFFADFVLNTDGKAVTPVEDAKIDPNKYLAGARRPTAGCISAGVNRFGEVIWAKVEHRRKVERGIRRGTDEYTDAIRAGAALTHDADPVF
jgi:hypothetical protein